MRAGIPCPHGCVMSFPGARSAFRLDVDPYTDAVARIIRQLGRLPDAVVLVSYSVALDPVLEPLVVAHLATLRVVRTAFVHHPLALAAPARRVVPDRGADDRTRHGGHPTTVAMSDLVADRRTDDSAE